MAKPFNLEAAKAGAKVMTRDGRPARIVCFDMKGWNRKQVLALVPCIEAGGKEFACTYDVQGMCYPACHSPEDLFMAPLKVMKWGLIMPARTRMRLYDTPEGAEHAAAELEVKHPLIIPVEWEE